MSDEQKKELLRLKNRADHILRKLRDSGYDIGWALAWLIQLQEGILEKDFARHNTAYIWFKNAQKRNKEFNDVFSLVCRMTSKIYLK